MNTSVSAVKSGVEEYLFDFMRFIDFTIIIISAFVAYYIRHNVLLPESHYYWAIVVGTGSFFITAYLTSFYKYKRLRVISRQIVGLFVTLVMSSFILIGIMFMSKTSLEFSRLWVMYWFLLNFVIMLILHLAIIRWFKEKVKQGSFVRKVVLFGDSSKAEEIINRVSKGTQEHIEILAIFTKDKKAGLNYENVKKLTTFPALYKFCNDNNIDDVIITYDISSKKDADEDLEKLREIPCNIRYCLPTIFFGKAVLEDSVWNAPIATIYHRPMLGRKLVLKRVEDVVFSLCAIIVASPVFIAIIIAQLLFGGKGSILFKQERNGFFGKRFHLYKFRSMREHKETDVITQAQKSDPRITKLGAFLRKSSLDELPQLFNILMGDMSLVGPRPHAVSHNKHYSKIVKSYASRNRMKPGLTGWAQVNGWRGETDTVKKMEKRVECDIYYVENWSLWLDIKIIFLTPFIMFHKNAY